MVHKSKEYISEYRAVLRDQQAKFAATRTGADEIPEIEQHSDYAISISNGQFVQQDDPVQPRLAKNSVLEWKETEAAQTRSTIATFPRPSDLLRIWLLRHSGYKAFQYEIDWQVNDVKLMIRDLNRSVRVEVHTRHTDFWASNDGFDTLYRFQKYVRDNADKGWQWSPSVGKDIFILVSYSGYGGVVAGLDKLDVYKIRRQQNPEAFGLSGINPITCVKTLAHELGHILGAGYSNHSWWDGWWIFKFRYYDVMSYKLGRAPFIRDPKNRRIVQDNLRTY